MESSSWNIGEEQRQMDNIDIICTNLMRNCPKPYLFFQTRNIIQKLNFWLRKFIISANDYIARHPNEMIISESLRRILERDNRIGGNYYYYHQPYQMKWQHQQRQMYSRTNYAKYHWKRSRGNKRQQLFVPQNNNNNEIISQNNSMNCEIEGNENFVSSEVTWQNGMEKSLKQSDQSEEMDYLNFNQLNLHNDEETNNVVDNNNDNINQSSIISDDDTYKRDKEDEDWNTVITIEEEDLMRENNGNRNNDSDDDDMNYLNSICENNVTLL